MSDPRAKEYLLPTVFPGPVARSEPPVSFGALLAVLGAATVVGVGAAVVLHLVLLIPVVLAVVLGVGVVYILAGGATEPPALPEPVAPTDEEPFEDPVEEADRLESSGVPSEGPAETGATAGAATPSTPGSDRNDAQ